MFEAIVFYIFAALTTAMFLMVVTTKNALYALSALAAGMIFISAFFFLLEADFLGVVQIVVYTGAIMALYAFGMMFFDTSRDVKEAIIAPKMVVFLSGVLALLLVIILTAPMVGTQLETDAPTMEAFGNVQDIGRVLFTKYLVPFEVAAVMLLVAMISGIVLAGKKMDRSLTVLDKEDEEDTEEFMAELNKEVKV